MVSREAKQGVGHEAGLYMERTVTRVTGEVAVSDWQSKTAENERVSHGCRGKRPSGCRLWADCIWLTPVTMRRSLLWGRAKRR